MRPSTTSFFVVCCVALLVWQLPDLGDACTSVRVTAFFDNEQDANPPKGVDFIGRTMELGGPNTGSYILPWEVVVHPAGEHAQASVFCPGASGWNNQVAYTSIDITFNNVSSKATEGMNVYGLTASSQVLGSSRYMPMNATAGATNVCWQDMAAWTLGTFQTVAQVEDALRTGGVAVVGDVTLPMAEGLHWTIDDATGAHAVIEYVDGRLQMHPNQAGVLTNDPEYGWHLRNLNQYVNVNPSWAAFPAADQVVTELGSQPQAVFHGANLLGLPADYSPASRFVRMFYLRQLAVHAAPPQSVNESVVLVTSLLNNVFIAAGIIANNPPRDVMWERTQYTVVKVPQLKHLYYKTYADNQWRLLRLPDVNFSHPGRFHLDESRNSIGARDVTSRLQGPASR